MTTDDIIAYCARKRYSLGYARYWAYHVACEVPGCGVSSDAPHHLRTRGAGGKDTPDNLLSLCTVHHRQAHDAGVRTFAARYPALKGKIDKALEAEKKVEKKVLTTGKSVV